RFWPDYQPAVRVATAIGYHQPVEDERGAAGPRRKLVATVTALPADETIDAPRLRLHDDSPARPEFGRVRSLHFTDHGESSFQRYPLSDSASVRGRVRMVCRSAVGRSSD